jgi:predicted regulator of Ras-like GTPase activity (Roadblock/LC7/MglB family)
MSFTSILNDIVNGCGGGLAAALVGADGSPIAEVVADGPLAREHLAEEIGTAGAEFGRILAEIAKASDALGGGAVHETCVVLSRFTLIFRNIDDETFLVLAIAPDGNLGKARYLMRRKLILLRQEL